MLDACKLKDKPPDVTEQDISCVKSENEISRSDDEVTCSKLGIAVLNETRPDKSLDKMSENLENRDSCSVKYFSYFVSLSSIDMF
jgi:hypothetical protein